MNDFFLVDLEQGTNEWREWRRRGIGCSDAPIIMGESPWKTAGDLLREKRGLQQNAPQNAAMALGVQLEPEARRRYIAKTGKHVTPACLQSTRHDWLRASVDGLSAAADAVVEIKCGESVYRSVSEHRCAPAYYYGQLQHILAVTGLTSIDLWCYWPGCPELLVPVERDDAYLERLLHEELEFWNKVQQKS
jgi:putative phage-type endonuclease